MTTIQVSNPDVIQKHFTDRRVGRKHARPHNPFALQVNCSTCRVQLTVEDEDITRFLDHGQPWNGLVQFRPKFLPMDFSTRIQCYAVKHENAARVFSNRWYTITSDVPIPCINNVPKVLTLIEDKTVTIKWDKLMFYQLKLNILGILSFCGHFMFCSKLWTWWSAFSWPNVVTWAQSFHVFTWLSRRSYQACTVLSALVKKSGKKGLSISILSGRGRN